MFEFAKKGLYLGLGLANLTKEKAEALAKELADRAHLTEEEGRKLAGYLQEESQKAGESLKQTVDKLVSAAMERLPCHACIRRIEARLEALETAAGISPACAESPTEAPCTCADADAGAAQDKREDG